MRKICLILFSILLLLIITASSNSIKAWEVVDRWSAPEPDYGAVYALVVVLIVCIVAVLLILNKAHDADKQNKKNKQERYTTALESMDAQLKDGKITEETYKELRCVLEEEHKQKWYE